MFWIEFKRFRSRRLSAHKTEVKKHVCKHCPYRKDKPHWLDRYTQWFNITMIHHKQIQLCHMNTEKRCKGASICLEGGNDQIVSPQELANRDPVPTDEMISFYNSEH